MPITNGTPGNDIIIRTTANETINGLAGSDRLTVNYTYLIPDTGFSPNTNWKLNGGDGVDTLTLNANIGYGGTDDFFDLGISSYTSYFDGGAGNDIINGKIVVDPTIAFAFGGSISPFQTVNDLSGNNKVALYSSASGYDTDILIRHVVTTGSGNDIINSTTFSEADNWNGAANIIINTGNGTNKINVNDRSGQSYLAVTGGIGIDTLNAVMDIDNGNDSGYRSDGIISLGAGDDVANVTFGGQFAEVTSVIYNINLGSGDNSLNVAAKAAGTFSITSGNGDDTIGLSYANSLVLFGTNSMLATVNAGDGNNKVDLNLKDYDDFDDILPSAKVTTGSGGDIITLLFGYNSTVSSGGGGDTIRAYGTSEKVNAGSGNDVIFIQSGNDTVIGGLGADTFRFTNAAAVNFAGDTHDIDLNFAQGDKLVFTGTFAGSGSALGSIAQLTAFDAANAGFTYFNLGSAASTVGDKITFTDTGGDLVTILL